MLAYTLSFGQSIYTNPITGTNPNLSNPYTTGQSFDSNIIVSGISRGSGINGADANNRYNAESWGLGFNTNDYFEFTLTPNADYKIDFSSFDFTAQSTILTGPPYISVRSSLDNFATNIGGSLTLLSFGTPVPNSINLSSSTYQNITHPITFRIYAWGAGLGGKLSINNFTFNGSVSCAITTTWSDGSWSDGFPSLGKHVIINDNYNTNLGGDQSSFSACSLTVNTGHTLVIEDNTYVEVENNVINNGTLIVESKGSLVQNENTASYTGTGISRVNKVSSTKNAWYYYSYWSSPVLSETIGSVFPNVDYNRRFWYNAYNYLDTNGDNIDDNADDWQIANGAMSLGVGYAVTSSRLNSFPSADSISFFGNFNTGDIATGIAYNAMNINGSWNLIGNPYPSAIDFDAFYAENASIIQGAAYFWSHYSPPDATNPGNETLNFNQSDYTIYTVGSGGVAGASGIIPNQYIPSCQSFFVAGLSNGNVQFTNAMRMANGTSNNIFFKVSNPKSVEIKNRLWINLTADNGLFSQILVSYTDGASADDDGLTYDATRFVTSDTPIALYSLIQNTNKKFAIQGKSINNLDIYETTNIGFLTNISNSTSYTLSIAQTEGGFLAENNIYIKDNLLGKVHSLSNSSYSFTSNTGEFNNRFEIMFNSTALSTNKSVFGNDDLKIINLNNNHIQFTVPPNIKISSVIIIDLLGRELYRFKGQDNSEVYTVHGLKQNIYIAKVKLANDTVIIKKFLKKEF